MAPSPRKQGGRKSSRNTENISKTVDDPSFQSPAPQWVFILPDSTLRCDLNNDTSPSLLQIKHPKSGQAELCLFSHDRKMVYEIKRFGEENRSWFIGDTVQEDGSMYMCTSMDPLFLLLPYIHKSNKFSPLEQVLVDEQFSDVSQLLHCFNEDSLAQVADFKDVSDLQVLRYNTERAMSWLRMKVTRLVDALKVTEVHVSGGSQVTTFVRSKKDSSATEGDYLRYAWGILSDYLPEEISGQLKVELGIQEPSKNVSKSPAKEESLSKKRKLDGPVVPTEDYSGPGAGGAKNGAPLTKAAKLSAAHRALEKVDKKGMKSITSFFTKKRS